jgi:hypothetical protein
VSHVQRVKRPQRCEGKDAEADDERIDDGDVPGRIAIGEKNITPGVRTNPPISFKATSNKVETSDSGGLKNIRIMSGLPLKMMTTPPIAARAEKIPKMIRKAR